jgi:RNA polymerase sigma factor (sigma-70 family)
MYGRIAEAARPARISHRYTGALCNKSVRSGTILLKVFGRTHSSGLVRRMSKEGDIENPYRSPACEAHSDGELLRRFTTDQDHAAFETLVSRHGPLVWSVCRGVLRSRQDAEDAFQATFLILLRQADSIRQRKSFRSWIFGVARRVAMKALRSEYRRLQFLHRLVREREADPSSPPAIGNEVRRVLDEELASLSEIQRTVIAKCVFAGESYRQVSEELSIPVATVASHLRRGRRMLRVRLAARGIGAAGLAALMPTLLLATESPPESLCRATAQNAAVLLSGDHAALPLRVVSLMKGVVTNMTATAKCILALALSLGAGASTWWALGDTTDPSVVSDSELAIESGPSVQAALVLDMDVPGVPRGSPSIEFVAELVGSGVEVATDGGPSVQPALVLEVDVPGEPQGSPSLEFVAEPSDR